jgi:hypothetical protein
VLPLFAVTAVTKFSSDGSNPFQIATVCGLAAQRVRLAMIARIIA